MESKSSLSHSNFNITIVELSAVAVPMYNDVMMSNQKSRPTINHAILLHITCNIQIRTVFVPNHWIVAGLSSVQIMNNRKTIHTWEKLFKNSYLLKKLGKINAMIVHASIYAIIIGCFNAFITHSERRTTHKITENDKKNWSI